MIYIASMFNKPFLVRTLAMRNSALRLMPGVKFLFMYTDQESGDMIKSLNYPDTHAIAVEDLKDDELMEAGKDKTKSEFAWMAKVAFMKYLFDQPWVKEGDVVAWVDSDILFYSSLKPTIDKMLGGYSIALMPHYFPKEKEYLNNKIGKYNAGMFIFKVDENSRLAFSDWRKQCIEWCYMRYEEGRLGDQMYLNPWTTKYKGVYEVPTKGVDIGPWRVKTHKIERTGNEQFTIDGDPLVCFHFHGYKFYAENNKVKPFPITVGHRAIYSIYTREIENAWREVQKIDGNWNYEFSPKPNALRLLKQRLHKLVLG
jgi:hypothetical protein